MRGLRSYHSVAFEAVARSLVEGREINKLDWDLAVEYSTYTAGHAGAVNEALRREQADARERNSRIGYFPWLRR